jgi:hypothetical protein
VPNGSYPVYGCADAPTTTKVIFKYYLFSERTEPLRSITVVWLMVRTAGTAFLDSHAIPVEREYRNDTSIIPHVQYVEFVNCFLLSILISPFSVWSSKIFLRLLMSCRRARLMWRSNLSSGTSFRFLDSVIAFLCSIIISFYI